MSNFITPEFITINVIYFASLRECLNISKESVELDVSKLDNKKASVFCLIDHLCNKNSSYIVLKKDNIKVSVNKNIINDFSFILNQNDEVAFLPPVTGG